MILPPTPPTDEVALGLSSLIEALDGLAVEAEEMADELRDILESEA